MNNEWMPPPEPETLPAHQPSIDELVAGSEWIDEQCDFFEIDAMIGIEEKSPVTLSRDPQ